MPLEAGLTASIARTVGPDDLASALGSGDVPVLATPRAIAWCEAATVAAVEDRLASSETTVGMRVRVDHIRPTGAGVTVEISAVLARVDGKRLTFKVQVADDAGDVAAGEIIRVIVDRERFLARV